jgi:Uma2 family endonuclease
VNLPSEKHMMAIAEDAEKFFEIVDGRRVPTCPPYFGEGMVISQLAFALANHVESTNIGTVIPYVLFRLPLGRPTSRRPDIAFVSYQRWPKSQSLPDEEAWEVTPDLTVEVVSPSDRIEELITKVVEYFECGVQLVWIIYPRQRLIHVYKSLTRLHGLTFDDELDGGDVIPGFRLALATLFPLPSPKT